MKDLLLVLVVVISVSPLTTGCHKATKEEILEISQRRIENVSQPSYTEKRIDDSYEVIAVIDDIPSSALVRVVVKRLNDGQILGALDAKCSSHQKIAKGDRVRLVYVSYMQTEAYLTGVFYVSQINEK